LAEVAQLRFGQGRLQFVGNFHECHGAIIAARGKRGGYHRAGI
jgi:hypothetical protein